MAKNIDYPALFSAVYHELEPLVGQTNAFKHAPGAVEVLVQHRHVVGSGRKKPRPRQDAESNLSSYFKNETNVPDNYHTAVGVVDRLLRLGLVHLVDQR